MTNHATLNFQPPCSTLADHCARWLVQIHPLDLERGPIELTKEITTLGRAAHCTIHIEEDSVSRCHAEIHRTNNRYEIIDLRSTNGVLINDVRVETAELRSGDRLQLGARIYRFLADSDFESQYHETVYSMMTRDGLTGAYNKRYLLESLEREVCRCKRYGRPIAVALIDVDHFKRINDTLGHLMGDDVLKELVKRLQSTLREDEVLGRFGGEEFAVVMVEADREHALAVCERCMDVIREAPFELVTGPQSVSISIGVAVPSLDRLTTPKALLNDADLNLYQAKRLGRNRVVSEADREVSPLLTQ